MERFMSRTVPVLTAFAALLVAACANPERSRDLSNPNVPAVTLAQQVCSNCHGLTGTAVSPNFPNLAAQTETYIVAQLNGFKSHNRQDPAGFEYMWGLSRRLSEAQIQGLAHYFATQAPLPQPVEGSPARLAAGQTLFENGVPERNIPACSTCHGSEGQGNESFPRLAGQHVDYVVKQLNVFQRTDQRPDGAIMKTVAHELTSEDIENVAAYVQVMASR
jgi:cytochrome c553